MAVLPCDTCFAILAVYRNVDKTSPKSDRRDPGRHVQQSMKRGINGDPGTLGLVPVGVDSQDQLRITQNP